MKFLLAVITIVLSSNLQARVDVNAKSGQCIKTARELFDRNRSLDRLVRQVSNPDDAMNAQIVELQKLTQAYRTECDDVLGAVAANLLMDSLKDQSAFPDVVGCISMLVYYRQESGELYRTIPEFDADLLNQSVRSMQRSVKAAHQICEKDIPDVTKRQRIFLDIN